jgi:hypothetical protein
MGALLAVNAVTVRLALALRIRPRVRSSGSAAKVAPHLPALSMGS